MIVRRESLLDCSPDAVWETLQGLDLLRYVAWPLLTFQTRAGVPLPARFASGQTLILYLRAFGILPLGRHHLVIESIDPQRREITTDESGSLAKVWRHRLSVHAAVDGRTRYEDEVTIDAGWRTPIVWLLASIFFWHRHRRWRRVATRLR